MACLSQGTRRENGCHRAKEAARGEFVAATPIKLDQSGQREGREKMEDQATKLSSSLSSASKRQKVFWLLQRVLKSQGKKHHRWKRPSASREIGLASARVAGRLEDERPEPCEQEARSGRGKTYGPCFAEAAASALRSRCDNSAHCCLRETISTPR